MSNYTVQIERQQYNYKVTFMLGNKPEHTCHYAANDESFAKEEKYIWDDCKAWMNDGKQPQF